MSAAVTRWPGSLLSALTFQDLLSTKNSTLISGLGNTSPRVSSLSRSDFRCRDVVLALSISGNRSQLTNEMSHVSSNSVTGLLRAEKFPEGHPLQPRNCWTAPRGLGLPNSGFIAINLGPEDGVGPPWEPACCSWEMHAACLGFPWGREGCSSPGGPGSSSTWLISFHANKKEIFAAIIK